ncbi:MAG TPA: FMN-binding protein [Trebonia sp.]|jgi:uncharacterized protein with FMN-binding domain|nr:FMN-binding protein [Trebonia sp.]
MLRPLLALGGTAAGLAAILMFKTHPAADTSAATAAPAPSSTSASGPKTSGGTKTTSGTTTVTGAVDNTQYGPMQVQLTLDGKKITNVKVLQHTDDGTESMQIDGNALPKLTAETLAAQSARIDAVSGASYTSAGYIKSLQSALDNA